MVPGAFDRPSGCLLAPRCAYVQSRCRSERPTLDGDIGAQARCFYPLTQVAA
jgi:dipeptide transport system ATP-binding protein